MDKQQVRTIYGRYSSVYDLIFSHLFSPRIKLGLERSGIEEGDRVLEVGVGTGISLASYPDSCNVVGIDLTRKMLEMTALIIQLQPSWSRWSPTLRKW
jgi:phosphatidylethanolamine/phosphatidyl-N-methylethanolamine N-methyltransferase